LCFVRRTISDHFVPLNVNSNNILAFKVTRTVLGTTKDVLMICTYIPPVGSTYYDSLGSSDGVLILEQCMLELQEEHGDCHFILFGDFNSRTGAHNVSYTEDLFDVRSDLYEFRHTHDHVINKYGKSLLTLCLSFDLSIINGSPCDDSAGKYTYVSRHGNSVIDYLIMSIELKELCVHFTVQDNVLSSHMPLEFDISCNLSQTCIPQNSDVFETVCRRWDDTSIPVYIENIKRELESLHLEEYLDANHVNIDEATNCLTACFLRSTDFLTTRRVHRVRYSKTKSWFDKECRSSKKTLNKLLRKYTRTRTAIDRGTYISKRKEYKDLIRRKKREYREYIKNAMQNSLSDSKEFWGHVRKISRRSRVRNNIGVEEWVQHFSSIYAADMNVTDTCHSEDTAMLWEVGRHRPMNTDSLESDITEDEIKAAITHLKTEKAAGPDETVAEMFKYTTVIVIPYLKKLFNAIFDTGRFPRSWSKSLIVPLHKKGSVDVPDNYRGISLISVLSKLFTFVLHQRLQCWTEENKIIAEEQAGFRKGYSTIDNVFVLHSIIQKYLIRHKKLYVAFIDYKKAFDTINRNVLWSILIKLGIGRKMYNVLRSMYSNVQSCVRCQTGCSEYFSCSKGLKQGCVLSPLLFSCMLQEMTSEVCKYGKHGVQLHPDITIVFTLLFADDVALCSDTVVGLQNQLDLLKEHSDKLGLEVNTNKSKVVVFRNGGYLARHEKWHIGRNEMEVVNEYRYLGITLSTRLCTNTVLNDLATRARAGVVRVMKSLQELSSVPPDLFFRIFDAQLQPILLYGSEVWGVDKCEMIEHVHLFALKKFLNVPMLTPNVIAYGETGRYPLSVNAILRSIKYWLRLLRMEEHRYPQKVYKMMLTDNTNDKNWASKVKQILCENGFEVVWRRQMADNEAVFLRSLRERLIEMYDNQWISTVMGSSRYEIYRQLKPGRYAERYLYVVDRHVFRKVFGRFRMGVSEILTHKLRYSSANSKVCPCCTEEEEEDIHVLLQCPVYADLRVKFLTFTYDPPNMATFVSLMSSADDHVIKATSRYLYHALRRRENALSTLA